MYLYRLQFLKETCFPFPYSVHAIPSHARLSITHVHVHSCMEPLSNTCISVGSSNN